MADSLYTTYIASADTDVGDADYHVVAIFDYWHRPVFKSDVAWTVQEAGGVLHVEIWEMEG